MRFISLWILRQRLIENIFLTNGLTWVLLGLGRMLVLLGLRGSGLTILTRAHRMTRVSRIKKLVESDLPSLLPKCHSLEIRPQEDDLARHFGERLMVLKGPRGEEKGVLFVMFSEMMALIASQMDLGRLMRDYHLVFEPSWSGYCDRDLLFFTQFTDPVFVLSAEEGDFGLLQRLDSNIIPIPLGPCDWVDPAVAEPFIGSEKRFDIVMIAHFGPIKRHHALFAAISKMDSPASVALISGGPSARIKALAKHYNVSGNVHFLGKMPYSQVMEETCKARISVLLSLKEGSNRALAESMFCDVPVLLLEEHVGGIRKNVVPQTGEIVPERDLAQGIGDMLTHLDRYEPREWALKNVSCLKSGEALNDFLRSFLRSKGLPWTEDLVHHKNSPEVQYYAPRDCVDLAESNAGLHSYLRGP